MRSFSNDFYTAITAPDREIRGYLKFNNDATKLLRGVDGLISVTHHAKVADQERPMFGCCCSAYCEVEFFNEGIANLGISLANSYFDLYLGVVIDDTGTAPAGSIEDDTATVEYIFMGRFIISEIQRGKASTKVTAYDEFGKLNVDYVPTVTKGPSGYAVADIVGDIKTQCGFMDSTTPSADMGYVDEIYAGTCRQVLGWVLNVSYRPGCNVSMSSATATGISVLRLSSAWAYKDASEHLIDDSVTYLDGLDSGDTFAITSVSTGTEDNPVVVGSGTGLVGENPYYDSTMATNLLTSLSGISFKPMKLEYRGNPALVIGDVMKVTADGENAYCYVQSLVTTFNGGLKQTIECYGDSEYHYEMSTSPTEAKIKVVSTTLQEMQERIETAKGGIITEIYDADGHHTETIIANSMDLATATSVWRFNINGMGHSNSYQGGTYNILLDDQGRLNASMILTGIISDVLGKNSWNLDTGALTITDGSIDIETSSASFDIIKLSAVSSQDSTQTVVSSSTPSSFGISHKYTRNGSTLSENVYLSSAFGPTSTDAGAYTGVTRYTRASNTDPFQTTSKLQLNATSLIRGLTVQDEHTNGNGSFPTSSVYKPDGVDVFNGYNYSTAKKSASIGIRSYLDNSGAVILRDGSTDFDRTDLGISGLTFKDSGGNTTATYPSTGLFKTLDLTPTLTSQYFQIQDAAITATTPIFVQNVYVSGGVYLNLTFTVQATTGSAYVYVRQASGTIPDNTQIHVSVLIML